MKKNHIIAAATAVSLATLGGVSAWAADPPPTSSTTAQASANADKARAQGIRISPQAEAEMARAPKGSCYNDPTQPACPKIEAVGVSQITTLEDGSVLATPVTQPQRSASRRKATPRQTSSGCITNAQAPTYGSGYAYARATQQCHGAVQWHQLFTELWDKTASYGWRWLNFRAAEKNGTSQLVVSTNYDCNHASSTRPYRTIGNGNMMVAGTIYPTGRVTKEANLRCP